MPAFVDLTGQRFERLLCTRRIGTKYRQALWLCRCDCGQECEAPSSGLRTGNNTSCGCKGAEQVAALAKRVLTTHGMRHVGEYRIWQSMKSRCYVETDTNYQHYGARGISVCDRWRDDFAAFYADMGPRPRPGRWTLERNEVNGNYEPNNCRWATMKEQQNNRTNNRLLTYEGRTQTLQQWADETGIQRATIARRLDFSKWSVKDTLTLRVGELADIPRKKPGRKPR